MKKNILYTILLTLIMLFARDSYAFDATQSNISGDLGDSYDAKAVDIDGDGDMDIYVVNYNQQNRLWLNDGAGNFTASDVAGDMSGTDTGAAMEDLDGDGDMDIYVTTYAQNRILINDGLGNGGASFTVSIIIGDIEESALGVLGDIDGDGDMDIYTPSLDSAQNKLWINDGLGNGGASFTASDIAGDLGANTYESFIADIDGDGDLDIYSTNGFGAAGEEQNKLWINDGLGNGGASFTASDIAGDMGHSVEAIFGDIDGDGDSDIYVSNWNGEQNKLWINDGLGNGGASFTALDIVLDLGDSAGARMKDLDFDGDLDLYVADYVQNKIWINDGAGNFASDNIAGDTGFSEEVLVADFDGDDDNDLYVARYGQQNILWINDVLHPSVITSNGGSTTATISLDENTNAVTTVTATDLEDDDAALPLTYSVSGGSDAALFSINSITGELVFILAPDFENPTDRGNDNIYNVTVVVTDSDGLTSFQEIIITLIDVIESTGNSVSRIVYVCKDTEALNYSQFGRHKQSECEYGETIIEEIEESVNETTENQEISDKSLDVAQCPYFTQYYKDGDKGGEIAKIQSFLKERSFDPGYVDSIIGPKTLSAIHFFQAKYFDAILAPWGLKSSTGHWYQSTRKKANELAGCPEGQVVLDNGIILI